MTDSKDTPEFLKDALKFGINLGLERMNKLDELLGNPEQSLKVVHIAGTNGKGSTSAFITSILAASDKKVGLYTSPFLERFSERMRIIDGRLGLMSYVLDDSYGEIKTSDLERLSNKVQEAASQMTEMGYEHPTEFELVTAIAYLWFAENDVDIVVLETGLGGRLDSTNVIANPLATVITAIGFDHTDRLGNTIEEIASEKAGIFKSGTTAYISEPTEMLLDSESQIKVKNTFVAKANQVGAAVRFVSKGDSIPVYTKDGYMLFCHEGKEYKTKLLGEHQISNCLLAISVACDLGVTDSDISYGVLNTIWKGRCEVMRMDPFVIIDGGHNYQGAQSLSLLLDKILGGALKGQPLRVVMGVMKDKAVDDMLKAFKDQNVIFEDVTAVKVNNPRTLEPHELYNKIKEVYNSKVEIHMDDDAVNGVLSAYRKSLEDGMPLLVTGSLYLLGQVRGALKSEIDSGS